MYESPAINWTDWVWSSYFAWKTQTLRCRVTSPELSEIGNRDISRQFFSNYLPPFATVHFMDRNNICFLLFNGKITLLKAFFINDFERHCYRFTTYFYQAILIISCLCALCETKYNFFDILFSKLHFWQRSILGLKKDGISLQPDWILLYKKWIE